MPAAAVAPLLEALEYLADPESWLGNPDAYGAPLHGHDSPHEIAVRALAEHAGTVAAP